MAAGCRWCCRAAATRRSSPARRASWTRRRASTCSRSRRGTVSRAEGDVHPLGNPHYYLDPKALEVVADHLARRVLRSSMPRTRRITPRTRRRSTRAWRRRSRSGRSRWRPTRERGIVPYHKNFVYFADRFGLKLFGTVEPKPGIPPTPRTHRRAGRGHEEGRREGRRCTSRTTTPTRATQVAEARRRRRGGDRHRGRRRAGHRRRLRQVRQAGLDSWPGRSPARREGRK